MLSDAEFERIEADLLANSLQMKALHHELLDHLCCSVEDLMRSNKQLMFEEAYQIAKIKLCPSGPQQIENETIKLLYFQKTIKMNKKLYFFGFLASVLISLTFVFRQLHWPGANVVSLSACAALILGVVPTGIMVAYHSRDRFASLDKWRFVFGLLAAFLVGVGQFFKVMHWPTANMSFLLGMLFFTLGFVPILFYQLYKRAAQTA